MNNTRMPEKFASLSSLTFLFSELAMQTEELCWFGIAEGT